MADYSPPADAASEDAPSQETREEKRSSEREAARWSRSDTRLLLVTFLGTVAANLLTVLIVALAILFARGGNTGVALYGAAALNPALGLEVLVIVGSLMALLLIRRLRRSVPLREQGNLLLVCVVIAAMTALLLLGFAEGVKT